MRGVVVLALASLLLGCATVGEKAKVGAYYTFATYNAVWRPPLKFYGGLPACGTPAVAPCQDVALYRKLYDLDAKVTDCGEASLQALASNTVDLSSVEKCVQLVEQAKIAIARGGLMK